MIELYLENEGWLERRLVCGIGCLCVRRTAEQERAESSGEDPRVPKVCRVVIIMSGAFMARKPKG
jgi:hypothetical protein